MDPTTTSPSDNVLQFRPDDRRKRAGCDAADACDHGPSPEESLRVMRAFVGIKNKQLRANLIDMLEGASREPAARPAKE
jgi:hypothetical protein